MKIIHTADLHLGQILYQNYDRRDEHLHFFDQLKTLCIEEQPDALIVAGDLFDIQNPSTRCWELFNSAFVELSRAVPSMTTVLIAGNHDSQSRIQSQHVVWEAHRTYLVGTAPTPEPHSDDWMHRYIIPLRTGFIVALPYMSSERSEVIQQILEHVTSHNPDSLPVVMTAHTAVSGSDFTGHDEIGRVQLQNISALGSGYDYLALGHIHKPQTIGHPEDWATPDVSYNAPVARYAGSALHVSCDEQYPHTFSIVNIDRHQGTVSITQKRIKQLRHFLIVPGEGAATSAEEAMAALERTAERVRYDFYFRFRINADANIPADFNQQIYDLIEKMKRDLRYNPKHIWEGDGLSKDEIEKPRFEIAELQQMTDPLEFIRQTWGQYAGLDLDELTDAFRDINRELERMDRE